MGHGATPSPFSAHRPDRVPRSRPGVSSVRTSGGAVAGADVVPVKKSGYAADLKAPERFVAWLLAGHQRTDMSDTDLEALRVRAVGGDGAALEALCRALAGPVYRLCLHMLGHMGDAEDAAQDVLVKVVTHLSQFEGRSALTTWVHQVAVRHLLGVRRSRAEELAVDATTLAGMLEQGLAYGAALPPPGPEERVLVQEVRLSCTQGMLLRLSREERLALVLVELLGLDGAEAAEVAGVSHAALRQRLARARAHLGEFLSSRCGLVSETAACRCERQVRARQAMGMGAPQLAPLCTEVRPPVGADVHAAAAELGHLRAVRQAFHRDGLFAAPERLRQRLAALLSSVL